MEAKAVDTIPVGEQWTYEPKWDGFRCLAFRNGDDLHLQSKSGQPLQRYFPDVVSALLRLKATQFVLDGEIIVVVRGRLSFDDLLQRIHPAASRVQKLAQETPATYVIFDLLQDDRGHVLLTEPLEQRRASLETFTREFVRRNAQVRLSPAATSLRTAQRWFVSAGGALDGVVAKRLDLPYQSGNRLGMQKIKNKRTAECVVGGFRHSSRGRTVGSLLLGLYDDDGLLHHVGFTSSFTVDQRAVLAKKLQPLVCEGGMTRTCGFTGRAPGGPSRWSTERSGEWQALKPRLVVEVQWDHFSGERFRHGTTFLRWRPDKAPRSCTMDQVAGGGASVRAILG